MSARLRAALVGGPRSGRQAFLAFGIRVVAGAIFIGFGFGKFVNHAAEAASFDDYGLPTPDAFVYVIGAIELGGGLFLILGLLTRLAALILAGDMVAAIVISGIAKGEDISFTLAPALLLAMLVLLWIGPGACALDRPLTRFDRASPT